MGMENNCEACPDDCPRCSKAQWTCCCLEHADPNAHGEDMISYLGAEDYGDNVEADWREYYQ